MHVSALHLHPVKSLRGCAVESVVIDRRGIAGDRRFLVTDPAGRFLTQRTLPRMALIATKLDDLELTLEAPGHGMIRVARASQPDAARAKVSVWSSEGLIAEDCGDTVAGWLSDFLATPCRLVRAGEDFTRAVRKAPVDMTGAEVGFADAYPGLLLTEASWADLNDRLRERGEEPVPMDRFRPNLVVAGATPYAEDTWTRVRIGSVEFRGAGPRARCLVTTTAQATAERGVEPLRTLAGYRRDARKPEDVNFGQNVIPEGSTGVIRVGDPVVVEA
ncbi:MAG: MOSC domain-containing protein [Opitutaceae bacterium]